MTNDYIGLGTALNWQVHRGLWTAVDLMLCGIALIGVVTASFASWLIERIAAAEEEPEAITRRDVSNSPGSSPSSGPT